MNLVSNTFSDLKKSAYLSHLLSPEELQQRNASMLNIVDNSISQYMQNLKDGKVKLRSSADLDRLVKLAVLLAENMKSPPTLQEDTSTSELPDDPIVQDLYTKLYEKYNKHNDIE